MKQKIQTLLSQLNHGLVDREGTFKTALLTVLAGENLVLIGPPGTGKSMIARRIANCLTNDSADHIDSSYFEYLLTKFSTPEEIFGPLSISELKQDRFKRNTKGYLPAVKMAFLDEIFKASSSILNALLTILNERIYHNGATPEHVPLRALIAASNELPTDQEELSALYDRFLVRSFVDYVSQDNLPLLFEKVGETPAVTKITVADVASIERAADSVTIPPDILDAVLRIWMQHKETFKEDRRESLSDRRLKKVIKLLSVSAATNGRNQIDLSDVFLLKDCLWNHQENAIKVRDLILTILQTCSRPVPESDDVIKPAPAPSSVKKNVQKKNVVKGLKGSGTSEDPILINTVDEFVDLCRPDVGMKGYFFRQTADIDFSALTSWTDIPFTGHYDGSGYTLGAIVTTRTGGFPNYQFAIQTQMMHRVFSSIHTQSSIANINLNGVSLSQNADGCQISHCVSTTSMLITDTASNCIITACQSSGSLIGNTASNCTITTCQSRDSLIGNTASNCMISDCLILVDLTGAADQKRGGIALTLNESSVVERCFVNGYCNYKGSGFFFFSGIASRCDHSTIRLCAIGELRKSSSDVRVNRLVLNLENSTLENNASIDSNSGSDDRDGNDGKTVAAITFKQRYFEHTLNWDFERVWQWDDEENIPALRPVEIGATTKHTIRSAPDVKMADLLVQQMQANIWL